MKKHAPNILSIFRLIGSVSLLFVTKHPIIFTAIYLVLAVTDQLDGFLARKFDAKTELGAKLDGIGDVAMFIVGFICVIFLLGFQIEPRTVITLGVAMLGKLYIFILTRVRFKEWNMMHTYLNKFLGFLLYIAVPICVLVDKIPFWYILVLVITALVSVVEDTYILLKAAEYEVNYKGVLFQKLNKA